MESNAAADIEKYFRGLKDPRVNRTKEHQLLDILVIAICAIICGANDWEAVAEYGRDNQEWFKSFLVLTNGIPSHDTFWRVFGALDPEQFQTCFVAWIQAVSQVTGGEIIAIDGKFVRGSHDKGSGRKAIDMVSAWASSNRLVLGQRKVDDKSNEITAIPVLLRTLAIRGCIVTIDAMGCQSKIAETIIEQGADYLLQLKENQPLLYEDTRLLFTDLEQSGFTAYTYDTHKTVDKDHGRIEIRQAWTISDSDLLCHLRNAHHFKNLQTVMKVRQERRLANQVTIEEHFYISSRTDSAATLLAAKRTHWQIENSLHWVLDIAFCEDHARLRKDNGAHNFAILRHIALNALKQETSVKLGLYNKRLKAAWNHNYLLKVLATLFH
jgi:predicted transposase YbfD/YdcC